MRPISICRPRPWRRRSRRSSRRRHDLVERVLNDAALRFARHGGPPAALARVTLPAVRRSKAPRFGGRRYCVWRWRHGRNIALTEDRAVAIQRRRRRSDRVHAGADACMHRCRDEAPARCWQADDCIDYAYHSTLLGNRSDLYETRSRRAAHGIALVLCAGAAAE